MSYQRTDLDNGIRVVTEDHPSSRAVACGIWIDSGTRDEKKSEQGISHFLEHMVFKGTKNRSAYDIVKDLEMVGAEVNAFTTKENTCFHTLSLYENLDLSVEVLADLVCRATFPKADLEVERGVILQELYSAEDSPEEYIFDVFLEEFYKSSSLGWQILGSEESVKSIKRTHLLNYYKSRYVGANMVVSAAGRLNHDELVKKLRKHLKRIPKGKPIPKRTRAKAKVFREILNRDSDQAHLLLGLPATSFRDRFRFEAFILNALLGGGMTSSLYQKVREDEGLVYSIYSSLSTFTDTGVINIYANATAENTRRVMELIFKEMRRLKKHGLTQVDLDLFRNQVRAGILLGADDVENRMNSLGVNEMVFGKYRSADEIIEELEAVTLSTMKEYMRHYLDFDKMSILVLGPKGRNSEWNWVNDL
jgi:predicted Zn-dependent peptidase